MRAQLSYPALLSPAGSASRRCLLSAQGVAYWGLPSFARCISHEYRYLYLSVSVPCQVGVLHALSQSVVGIGGSLRFSHSWINIQAEVGISVWQTPTHTSKPTSQVYCFLGGVYPCAPITP